MLDTLFMDGLYSDIESMARINLLIVSVRLEHRGGSFANMHAIDTMLVVPSQDLRVIAARHRRELPFALRALLRGVSGRKPSENRLLSFLLFEEAYTRELIDLGYQDAMKVKDQLLDFVTGAAVPRLFAPDWIQRDLSSLHGQ
jgi:NTE family protein